MTNPLALRKVLDQYNVNMNGLALHKTSAILCTCLCLLTGPAGIPGLVYCIGEDGHSGIELEHDVHPCAGFNCEEQSGIWEFALADTLHEHSCVDIPLLSDTVNGALRLNRPDGIQITGSLLVGQFNSFPTFPIQSTFQILSADSVVHPLLQSIQTTILRL